MFSVSMKMKSVACVPTGFREHIFICHLQQLDQLHRLSEPDGTNDILRQVVREIVPTYHEPQDDITAKEAKNAREAAMVRDAALV